MNEDYHALLMTGDARTVIDGMDVLLCAGVHPMTDTWGRAWALVSQRMGRKMVFITKQIKLFLSAQPYDRIDTPVRREFDNGHRWCDLMGFVKETNEIGMRHFGIDGSTYDLYAMYPKE